MKNLDKSLSLLNDRIQLCARCQIALLPVNSKNLELGYGKLYGWKGRERTKFMFVGLNPSHRRFANLECAFGGSKFTKGTGVEFVKILDDLGIKEQCFVDNLCHCSTMTNSVSAVHVANCFPYLYEEIEILTPVKIIAMGSQVFSSLELLLANTKYAKRLFKIFHPNFVISYRRDLIDRYREEIKELCS